MKIKETTVKFKKITAAIAFTVAFVMILTLMLEVFGTGRVKPSEWFRQTGDKLTTDNGEKTGGLLIPTETKGNNIAMRSSVIETTDYDEYGISPQTDSAYTVTAVVYPELATNRNVTWSVAWRDATKTWSNGKAVADYVTFSEVEGEANTVRVSCLKGFNEQIILTATSESESFVKAEVPIDYIIRVIGMTATFKGKDLLNNNASVSKMISTGTASPFGGDVDVYSFSWDEDIQVTKIQCNAFFSNVGTVYDDCTYSCTWKHSTSWIAAQEAIEAGRNHFCNCADDNTLHSGASCNCGKVLNIGRYAGVCDSSVVATLRTNSAGGVTMRNVYQSMVRNHYCMEFILSAFGEHCAYQKVVACNFDDSVKIAAEQVETTAPSGLYF